MAKKKPKKIEEPQERRKEEIDGVTVTHTEDGRKVVGNGGQLDYLLPKQTYQSVWETPEAFAKYIENLSQGKAWLAAGWETGEGENFYGTKDMDSALELARYGWKEGAEKIEKLRGSIKAMYPKSPKLILHGLAGATPNVPRAVAGNLFNMRMPDAARSKKKPTITLMANMSANWTIDKDMISNRAAVLAAVIDDIESAGYSCEVIATAMSKGGYGRDKDFKAATSIIVKPSHQPVDIVRLAFALGHASLFRRLIFADWGTEQSCQTGLGHGLGNAGGGFKEEEKELLEKSIYMLPSAETKSKFFKDDQTAMTTGLPYLIQHLKDLGCPPFKNAPEWEDPDKKKKNPIFDPDDDYPDEDDDD